jgi:predicted metal-dependent hydrolase
LAVTAALEHFTATLAELVLSSEETRDLFGHPAVRDLFVWHALEESEHKAVAFDVYKAIGGSERTRVVTMNILRFGFVISMAVGVTVCLLGDRDSYRRGNLRRSWRTARRSPFMTRDLWLQLRDYNRHDFHPDDSDTSQLVEKWRTVLFGEEGTLNDKLATSAA